MWQALVHASSKTTASRSLLSLPTAHETLLTLSLRSEDVITVSISDKAVYGTRGANRCGNEGVSSLGLRKSLTGLVEAEQTWWCTKSK